MSDADSFPNLNFSGATTSYSTHGMHSFPARFPPQIVKWAINKFIFKESATILDPMCGSGTTLVESILNGYDAKGIDKDPLARLMTRVKTTPVDTEKLEHRADLLRRLVVSDVNHYRNHHGSLPQYYPNSREERITEESLLLNIDEVQRPQWNNLDYWFYDRVIDELSLINDRIQRFRDKQIRGVFEITFSATLVTKGKTSLVNAHDIAHSRAHKVEPNSVPDTLERFLDELNKKIDTIKKFSEEMDNKYGSNRDISAKVIGEDARNIPLRNSSIELIVTSPPYINALNYVRATKYSLYWLRWLDKTRKDITSEYIGTDRGSKEEYETRIERATQSSTANSQINKIAENNKRMAGVVHRFVEDMHTVIGEMYRVLKPNSHCILVVGNSDIRDVQVDTHNILNELAEDVGFQVEHIIPRRLDNNKRSLPTNRGDMKDGMHDEFVLQWKKEENS